MKIVKPKVIELTYDKDTAINHIARCARICTGHPLTGGLTESEKDVRTVNNLIKSKHNSVFRHWIHYVKFRNDIYPEIYGIARVVQNAPQVQLRNTGYLTLMTFNHNIVIDYPLYCEQLLKFEVTLEEFMNTEYADDLRCFTFACRTQISTSRELNRVSPNAIVERSTRYVEEGTICQSHWFTSNYDEYYYKYDYDINCHYLAGDDNVWHPFANFPIYLGKYNQPQLQRYLLKTNEAFEAYKALIKEGMAKEDARGLLPIDTMTVVIYTYSLREWKRIIDNRYYGITGRPHPNAKFIAGDIKNAINEYGYAL